MERYSSSYGSYNRKSNLVDYNKLLKTDTFCVAPWMEAHIAVNGKVMPCCIYNEDHAYGNIKEKSLAEAYNSDQAKKTRQELVSNIKHVGCIRCWDDEERYGTSYRTEHNRMYGEISKESFEQMSEDFSILPLYLRRLDLRFDNKCNLKCRICSPKYSTSWFADNKALVGNEELKHLGGDFISNEYSISINEEVFESLLKALKNVKHLFFAGGEPLIQDKHYEILQYCIDNGYSKDIDITYNTNFSKLTYKKHKALDYWKHFKSIACSTSLDDSKERGEYQRTNIKWDQVIENRKSILDVDNINFQIAPTISIFNVFHIIDFVEEWIELGYITPQEFHGMHSNILYFPKMLNIVNLPESVKMKIKEKYSAFQNKHKDNKVYRTIFKELDKILIALDQERQISLDVWRQRFFAYTDALDKLRGENFEKVFPEYADLRNIKE